MSFMDKFRAPQPGAPGSTVVKDQPTFEERINGALVDEAYAYDLLHTAKDVLLESASAQADVTSDIDAEVRRLYGIRANAEAANGRASFFYDQARENLTLVETPLAGA